MLIEHTMGSILTAIQTLKQHTDTLGISLSCMVSLNIQGEGDFLQPTGLTLLETGKMF